MVAIFGRRILNGQPIAIFGDGDQQRDYVYVSDVVEANWRASTTALPPAGDPDARAWNIGTGRGTSVNELAGLLMGVAGRTVERRHAAEREGELRRSVLDCARAAAELGWRAETPLETGLARTMEHLREENR